MGSKFLILIFFLISFLFLVCSKKDEITNGNNDTDYSQIKTADISYSQQVQVILNEYKKILTDANIFPPGLHMDSWENLIKGWERGEAVIPFDSENSLLIELTTKLENKNELRADKLDLLQRWIDDGAKNDDGEVPYANSQHRLYVCSQGEAIVHIIDTGAKVVMRNIDLVDYGLPRFAKPHHVAFTPDGKYYFVSCIETQVNKVLKFEVATNELVGEVSTEIPALLAHHPSDDVLYVSRFMLNNSTNSIFAVNSQTMTPLDEPPNVENGVITLPPNLFIAHAMALSKNGAYVYTTSFSEDWFLVVNHASKEFVDAINLHNDRTPLQVAVSPDDKKVFISCIGTGEVVVMDVNDPNDRHIETAVAVGGQPWHGAFTHDGSAYYVGNLQNNNFSVINTGDYSARTFGAGDGSDGLSQPHGIAVSADDHYVFISGRNTGGGYHPYYDFGDNANVGTVVVINTSDNSIEKVIEIEDFGSGMRLWPED